MVKAFALTPSPCGYLPMGRIDDHNVEVTYTKLLLKIFPRGSAEGDGGKLLGKIYCWLSSQNLFPEELDLASVLTPSPCVYLPMGRIDDHNVEIACTKLPINLPLGGSAGGDGGSLMQHEVKLCVRTRAVSEQLIHLPLSPADS